MLRFTVGGNLGLAQNPKRCKVGWSPPFCAGWENNISWPICMATSQYAIHIAEVRLLDLARSKTCRSPKP